MSVNLEGIVCNSKLDNIKKDLFINFYCIGKGVGVQFLYTT